MGLFSSLGGILGGAVGSIFPGVGTVIGAGLGSAIGGGIDDNRANKTAEGYYNKNMDFAQRQFQFQQDYIKNSAQWRVEDAKKAGLHPMAALGMSTPSFSPISAPSAPEYASSNSVDPMEFGQNLNYAATKAKTAQQQQQMADLTLRGMELDNEYKQAQIDLMKVDALASSIASNQAVNSPPSPQVNLQEPTGLPSNPKIAPAGTYVDKPIVRDGWVIDDRGRKTGIIPSEDIASRFEDKLIVEWVPFMGSVIRAFKGKFLGQEVNGHYWHGDDKGFLPYPLKKTRGFLGHAADAFRFYNHYYD